MGELVQLPLPMIFIVFHLFGVLVIALSLLVCPKPLIGDQFWSFEIRIN
jgi:hypothetical protein